MAMDRRIKLMTRSTTQNAYGEQVISYTELVETWAEKVWKRGSEQTANDQKIGVTIESFRIRYRTGISQVNTIQYDGAKWEVLSVQEESRKQFLVLDCELKDSE